MKKFSVCIIGLGNIAQGYDNTKDDLILTHIKAFKHNNVFNVLTVFDLDKNLSKYVANKWQIPYILDDLNNVKYHDVICICSPDSTHNDILYKCLKIKPKLVFCEKPLSLDENESFNIVNLYKENNISLCVNYSRRWIKKIELLKNLIDNNDFGQILSSRIKYYNGFLSNGSHFIDLIQFFLEPNVKNGFILSEEKYNNDNIISGGCYLNSKLGNFNLMIEGYNGNNLNPLELELIFQKARIKIEEENSTFIILSILKDNIIYKGYREFVEIEKIKINPSESMIEAVKNIENNLQNNSYHLKSNGESALETLKLCKNITYLRKTY